MSETVATAPADVPVSTSGKVGARRSSRIWIVSGIALAVASGGALWLLAARTAIRSSLAEQQHAQDEQRRYQAQVTHAQRAEIQAALALAQATVQKAQAALDLAQQDQKHTTIFAAVDGVVGNRQVQTGDYVTPGQRLMTLVPLGDLYVMANFKETQTDRIQPGQKASVSVDALPGVKFSGVVDSLAPGSGSTFALLPFEPGTGNFTKIVQRVPVRIRLNDGQPALASLRPGLSVDARIDLRD